MLSQSQHKRLRTCSCSHAEASGIDSLRDGYTMVSPGPAPNRMRKGQCDRVNIISFTKDPTVKVSRKDLPKETDTGQMC